MELSLEEITLLEAYWEGTLNAQDRILLEDRLKNDIAFNIEVREWQVIFQKGMQPTQSELKLRTELKSQLNEIEASLPPLNVKGISRIFSLTRLTIYSIAASLLILIVASFFIINAFKSSDNIPYLEMNVATLSSNNLTPGTIAYGKKQYAKAWPILIQEIQSENDELNYLYAGIAALKAGQPEKAIDFLKKIQTSQEWIDYHPASSYYLAHGYIELNQFEKAAQLLVDLQSNHSNSKYAKLAKALLEEMEKKG